MDIIGMAMCKPKIINLNDFGIYMMNIMSSGETVIPTPAGAAFLAYAYKVFESGRLPIPYDEDAQIYLVPSSINDGQMTGSIVGAMPSGETITFIKADIVILADRIAMFTTTLS